MTGSETAADGTSHVVDSERRLDFGDGGSAHRMAVIVTVTNEETGENQEERMTFTSNSLHAMVWRPQLARERAEQAESERAHQ